MVHVFARTPDGTETDITEGVRALYDLVICSMDWRSGFLTYDDALPVLRLAETCGFDDLEGVRKYVDEQHHSEEQRAFLKERQMGPPWFQYTEMPHDHVFSAAGKCMWPYCCAKGPVTTSPPAR